MTRWIKDLFRGERGTTAVNMAGVVALLLVVALPVLWDFATIYVSRGNAQSAADASSLAAAEAYVDVLPRIWPKLSCPPEEEPDPSAVGRYVAMMIPLMYGTYPYAYEEAVRYALLNHWSFPVSFNAYPYSGGVWRGVWVPYWRVDVQARRIAPLILTPLYRRLIFSNGRASALVYLKSLDNGPCSLIFTWKIKLIR
jgi:hypothetical protein